MNSAPNSNKSPKSECGAKFQKFNENEMKRKKKKKFKRVKDCELTRNLRLY